MIRAWELRPAARRRGHILLRAGGRRRAACRCRCRRRCVCRGPRAAACRALCASRLWPACHKPCRVPRAALITACGTRGTDGHGPQGRVSEPAAGARALQSSARRCSAADVCASAGRGWIVVVMYTLDADATLRHAGTARVAWRWRWRPTHHVGWLSRCIRAPCVGYPHRIHRHKAAELGRPRATVRRCDGYAAYAG